MASYANEDFIVEELVGKQGISSPVQQSQKVRISSSHQGPEKSEMRNSLADKFSLKDQTPQLQSSIAIQKLLGITPAGNNAGQINTATYTSQIQTANTPVPSYTSPSGLYGGVTENYNANSNVNPSSLSGQYSTNIQGYDYKYDNQSNIPNYNSNSSSGLTGLDAKSDSKINQTSGNQAIASYYSAIPSSLNNKSDIKTTTVTTITNNNYATSIQDYKPYVPSSTQATIGTNFSTSPYVPLSSTYPAQNYSVRASQEYFPITDSKQLIKDSNQTKGSAIVEKIDQLNPKNQDIYGSLQVNNQLKYGGSISGVNSIRDTLILQNQNLTSNVKDSITINPSLFANQFSNSPKNQDDKATQDQYKIQSVLSKFASYQPTPQGARTSGLKNSTSQLNIAANYPSIPNETVEETIKRANNTLKSSLLKSSSTKNLSSNFNTKELSAYDQGPSSYNYQFQQKPIEIKQNEKLYTKESVIQDFVPPSQTYQAPQYQLEDYSSKYKVNTKESVIQDFVPSKLFSAQNQQIDTNKQINTEQLNTKQSEIQDFDPSRNLQPQSYENKVYQYDSQYQNYNIPSSSVKTSSFAKANPLTTKNQAENSRVSSFHKPSNSISQSPIRENPPSFQANMFNTTPSKFDQLRIISTIQAGAFSTNWQQIIQKGEKDGIEFNDSEFPATLANIGGKYPDVVSWLRPRDIFNTGYEVFVKGIDPTTLISGDLGDYYFQGAVSALAERDYSILKLFQTKSVNKAGCYVLNICWKGVWTSVILDDKFPTKGNKQICFTRSSSNELWAMLLEKAWAKLHGSYAKIDGGLVREVLHDFTGAPCRNFFTSGEGFLNRQLLWQKIQYAEDKDLIVLASCMDDLLSAEQEEIKDLFGIDNVHPYTILGTICLKYQNKDYKFIKLRNTYVKQEWQPMSEDKYFNKLPQEVINQLSYGGRCTREGFFLMEYEFFYKFFTDVQICYQFLGYQYTGEKLCTMTAQKNYFKLQISQAGYYFFQVSQQSIRTERISDQMSTTERDYYSQVYLVVAPESNPSQPVVAVKGNQRDLTSFNYIDNPTYLPQGEYLAFIEVDWKSSQSSSGNCGFGAYGSNYIEIRVSNSNQCQEFANYVDKILNDSSKWEQV
ncbi:calpain family cysteine protease (macronuclear) [Tetrahymena thermophila SB210]|uniref:Calpain family cysteine protease n=1 Tax=Tetrahymena thermophila (strain SB210) TaxID=312017 RepID=I7MHC5_TETTS|nr:calpain family cysteine protease [Tetrahymena thermophila SB210]EAR87401.2 calpain family cysteine protease [Tetrahymena thermophila SB210]|eukprot:XP_001007646.2 calpain family cysteine protease [Tetrahymena thermophila SB210]